MSRSPQRRKDIKQEVRRQGSRSPDKKAEKYRLEILANAGIYVSQHYDLLMRVQTEVDQALSADMLGQDESIKAAGVAR